MILCMVWTAVTAVGELRLLAGRKRIEQTRCCTGNCGRPCMSTLKQVLRNGIGFALCWAC